MVRGWRRGTAAGVAAVLAVLPPAAGAWWVLEADLGVVPPDDVLVTMSTDPPPETTAAVARERYPRSRTATTPPVLGAASVTEVSLTASPVLSDVGDATPDPTATSGGTGGGARAVGDLGIPDLVLEAYHNAADRLARSRPGCGVSWSLLAGIGMVESGHARGGRVDAAGRTYDPILGPRLDGVSTAAIRDTDGGRLDGDTVWDRAVGPMQFIPGTWAAFGTDGNDDGVKDPHNVFDAAMSAGTYLCAGGGDLRTEAGRVAALLRYNRSMSYVATVLAWAEAYESGQVRPTRLLPPGPRPSATPSPTPTTPAPTPTPTPTPAPTTGPPSPTPSPTPTSSPTPTPTPTPTTGSPGTTTPTPTPTTTTPAPTPTETVLPTEEPTPTPTETDPGTEPVTEPAP